MARFSGVRYQHVARQAALLNVRLPAEFALERLLTGVRRRVVDQAALVREVFPARFAFVFRFAGVQRHVRA